MLRKVFQFWKKKTLPTESTIPKRNELIRPTSSMRRATAHQVVIKQGYLEILPEISRMRSSLKRPVKKWFVFGCLNGHFPFLDCYSSEESIFGGVPERSFDLKDCLYVLCNQSHPSTTNYVFTIVLKDFRLSLATVSRTLMQEWSATIERHLKKYGIIDSIGGENDYILMQYWPKNLSREHSFTRRLPPFPPNPTNELPHPPNDTTKDTTNDTPNDPTSDTVNTTSDTTNDATNDTPNDSTNAPHIKHSESQNISIFQDDDVNRENVNDYEVNLYSNFDVRERGPYMMMFRLDPETQLDSTDDYIKPNSSTVNEFSIIQ